MQEALFYLFAALTVAPALILVLSRNVVNAAMLMIVSFVGTAAMYGLLQAYFLAVLQVLVYAGAVVVLFLFIIMLLDASHIRTLKPSKLRMAAATIGFLILVLGVATIFNAQGFFGEPSLQVEVAPASVARNFGVELFTRFMLPFQLAGFLLLAAMLGVIYISKKKVETAEPGAHRVAPAQPSVVKER